MVVGAFPVFSEGKELLPAAVSPSNKCRYKTGKCNNVRSSKRNGQPHQLCLYHRDKANKIQRKFDRQKRQIARVKKMATSSMKRSHVTSAAGLFAAALPAPMAGAIGSAAPNAFLNGPAAHFASLASHEVEIYSDSDSSRFSTDSEASVLDSLWQDLPKSAYTYDAEPTVGADDASEEGTEPVVTAASSNQGHLSYDEIDFLCSAMLE